MESIQTTQSKAIKLLNDTPLLTCPHCKKNISQIDLKKESRNQTDITVIYSCIQSLEKQPHQYDKEEKFLEEEFSQLENHWDECYVPESLSNKPIVSVVEQSYEINKLIQLHDGSLLTLARQSIVNIFDSNTYQRKEMIIKKDEVQVEEVIGLKDGRLAMTYYVHGQTCFLDKTVIAIIKFSNFSDNDYQKERLNAFSEGFPKFLTELFNDQLAYALSCEIYISFLNETKEIILKGHTGTVIALLQLQSGLLASVADDETIRFWNIKSQQCLCIIDTLKASVSKLFELQNSKLLLVSHEDEESCLSLSLFERATHKDELIKSEEKICLDTVIELLDGRVAYGENKSICLYDTINKKEDILTGHHSHITCLIQMRNGILVSSGYFNTLKMWNLITYQCIGNLECSKPISRMIELNDGRVALIESKSNEIPLCNLLKLL